MELDIETTQQLKALLSKPAMVSEADLPLLSDLALKYPYYQPLQLLIAKAKPEPSQLAKAALYNGGRLLHQIIHQPEAFYNDAFNYNEPEEVLIDEQETFEEINELDLSAFSASADDEENEIAEKYDSAPDELAIEHIVAADFFAFEKNFNTEQLDEHTSSDIIIVTQPEEYNLEAEAQSRVSKYNDDKLPYTFLWWLAKTRKEHEQIFQPYVTTKQTTAPTNELQQQYVEHIFHLQSPFNVGEEAVKGPLKHKTKNLDIIDSFIKNDPQIKTPKAEQINNENKAKKSAEDNYDLVSETLAAIYIEQMLYHKAIDTYEKLSLKFPEKSRYFADLIQSLEKKI